MGEQKCFDALTLTNLCEGPDSVINQALAVRI
jgi:hypothetical protein